MPKRRSKRRKAHRAAKDRGNPIKANKQRDDGLAFLEHLLRLEREHIPILPEHPPTH